MDATIPGYRGLNERITRGDTKNCRHVPTLETPAKNGPANTRHFAKVRRAAMFDNSAAQLAARA
jgi:hypothetical protein